MKDASPEELTLDLMSARTWADWANIIRHWGWTRAVYAGLAEFNKRPDVAPIAHMNIFCEIGLKCGPEVTTHHTFRKLCEEICENIRRRLGH